MKASLFNSFRNKTVQKIYFLIKKQSVLLGILIIINVFHLPAQPATHQFEVVNHTPLLVDSFNFLGIASNNSVVYYKLKEEDDTLRYKIYNNDNVITVNALSSIEYASKAGRIVVYGDTLNINVDETAFGYVHIYSGSGMLIKSLGLLAAQPFVAALSKNGSFIIAGKRSEDSIQTAMFLARFDRDGNKQWEHNIPVGIPSNLFASDNYTALVLDDSDNISSRIEYYNASGSLLFTDTGHTSVSGIEFLPSDKVVVCTGSGWYLYNMEGYQSVASGKLQGNTIGRYPITAHPSQPLFFIVSLSNDLSVMNGLRLQAFSSIDGSLAVESVFEGEAYWQPYHLIEVMADDKINLITTTEMLTLKLK